MSFSVVIDSTAHFKFNSVYDIDYAIDWSFLPEGEYDLTFSFNQTAMPLAATNVKAIALLGLGTQMKTYTAGSLTDTKTSNVIGLLTLSNFNNGSVDRQTFTQSNYNPPIILNSRPGNNIFKVKIMASSTIVGSVGMGGSYLLILHFNKRN